MKLHYIKSLFIVCGAAALTGCTDNSWNDTYLDGFEAGAVYNSPVTVDYQLTKNDYETIGAALYKIAETDEEKAAANSIRNNYFFDQSSCYPLEVAVPYLLNAEKTDFYIYNPGSHINVSLAVAQGVPAELSQISAAQRWIFTYTPYDEESIINKLEQKFPSATEGQYVIATYNPLTRSTSSRAETNQAGEFIYTPSSPSRAAETVWSVAEALNKMEGGYEGEAIVKGIVSAIDEISLSYGNATYYIKDNLSDENSLEVYRGYSYNKDKFTSEDQLTVGMQVYVSGSLVNYNGTFEFTSGSQLLTENELPSEGGDDNGDNNGGNTSTPDSDMRNLTDNIKNLAAGQTLTATAMVTGVADNGFVITDRGGSIYTYLGNDAAYDPDDYPVGTVIRISGTVSQYMNSYELIYDNILVVGEGSYKYPTPIAYTAEMIDEAVASTEIIDPIYVSIEGISMFNYIQILGTSVQGLIFPTKQFQEELTMTDYYKFTGYYIHTTSTDFRTYFNMVVTEVEPMTPPIEEENVTNVLYVFNGTTWTKAENATVLPADAYAQMGFEVNNLTDPNNYLPNYMKQAFPYAQKGDEKFVAYNITNDGCACSLLLFDGNQWAVNDNYLENKVADFMKSNSGGYEFRKYIGEEVYYLFEEDEIAMNCGYLFVWGDYCANPVDNGSRNYGYLYTTDITIDPIEHSVVMPNGYNTFYFVTETEYNGNVYTAPEGKFMIVDSEGRYMSCGEEQYYTFYIREGNAYINNDGTISDAYLFWGTKQEDGSWKIDCEYENGGQSISRSIYYAQSSSYKNFAVYTPSQAASHEAYYPMLYISADAITNNESSPEE